VYKGHFEQILLKSYWKLSQDSGDACNGTKGAQLLDLLGGGLRW